VARLTHRELGLDELRAALDGELRNLIGWDVASWATTDPATVLFTSCIVVGRDEDHEVESRLFALEFASLEPTSFAALARRKVPAASLLAATQGDLAQSPRWTSLLCELGVTDELRVAFVEGGNCWGTLAAYRMGGPPFTADDVATVAEISPAIAAGLRTAMLHTASRATPEFGPAPGVILVSDDGSVAELSTHAEQWLDQIGEPGRIPAVLRALAASARAAGERPEQGHTPLPARARLVRRDGGWIHLHATLMKGSRQIAVVIDPATEIHLADVLVRAYNLTRRERDVTELVVRGHSTAEIADALFISQFTVQDHLKNILAKAAVANRRELVAALYGRHYAPHTKAGALPSPYGWYLPR
jgi:DNA-binding CsgD family transcriptional regulator